MKLKVLFILSVIVYSSLVGNSAYAQPDSIRGLMVKSLSGYLLKNYLSQELAQKMADTIQSRLANGLYDTSLNADEFAYALTLDLRRISNDRHIGVWPLLDRNAYVNEKHDYSNERKRTHKRINLRAYVNRKKKNTKHLWEKWADRTGKDMFKYGEIKLLPGKVGYIEIKQFNHTAYRRKRNKGRVSLQSAMQFLEKAESLIIDLRENEGGAVRQSMAFCSWFAPAPKTYFKTEQYSFLDPLDNKRKLFYDTLYTSASIYNRFAPPKKVYILISSRTFSAAEYTAYKIKRYLPSAIIIGEKTTGGGNAHFGVVHELYFSAIIPHSGSFDAQNENYSIEGKGIVPDIAVPADSAYAVATRLAGIKSNYTSKDETRYFKKDKQNITQPLPRDYRDYLGNYNRAKIIEEKGSLYIVYDELSKYLLRPAAVDFFEVERWEWVRFTRNVGGKVTSIQLKYPAGHTECFRLEPLKL